MHDLFICLFSPSCAIVVALTILFFSLAFCWFCLGKQKKPPLARVHKWRPFINTAKTRARFMGDGGGEMKILLFLKVAQVQ